MKTAGYQLIISHNILDICHFCLLPLFSPRSHEPQQKGKEKEKHCAKVIYLHRLVSQLQLLSNPRANLRGSTIVKFGLQVAMEDRFHDKDDKAMQTVCHNGTLLQQHTFSLTTNPPPARFLKTALPPPTFPVSPRTPRTQRLC